MNVIGEARKMSRSTLQHDYRLGGPWMGLSRQRKFHVFLYLIFPILAGFVSAMQGSGRTSGWPLGFRIAYYVPLALVVMWSSGLCSLALSKLTRALHLPLWFLLIAGALLAGEIIKLYVQTVVPLFDQLLPQSALGGRSVEFNFSTGLRSGIPTILTWLGLNLAAWFFFKVKRFGYTAPIFAEKPPVQEGTEDMTAPSRPMLSSLPLFARKAGLTSLDQIQALEAQQHYLKIYGVGFEKVVLYRFSDAIAELSEVNGMQVHRSWWVRNGAIKSFKANNKRLELTLVSGLVLPVSRTYQLKVSEALGGT